MGDKSLDSLVNALREGLAQAHTGCSSAPAACCGETPVASCCCTVPVIVIFSGSDRS